MFAKDLESTLFAVVIDPIIPPSALINSALPHRSEEGALNVGFITVDTTTGKVYTELTGRFPVMSLR